MNNKNVFFNLIDPIIDWIDNGRFFKDPFKWIYTLFAVLNLLFPLVVLIGAVQKDIFSAPGKFITAFILLWLLLAFAGWVGFQIWWNRKDKVMKTSVENDRFVATPIFTHLIQTAGEWAGFLYAIIGCGGSIILLVILGKDANSLAALTGTDIVSFGASAIIMAPITGFLVVVVSRVIAELYRALVEIANNTRKSS